jgi:succinyl-diaminopimelate desuccinylase
MADNAIHRAAAGIHALAQVEPEPHEFDGLAFTEAVSVTRVEGGIAANVIPDLATAHVNMRYPPGTSAADAERRLRAWCEPHGTLTIDSNAPSGPVATGNTLVQALVRAGDLEVAPKQAWTPVAEFGAVGIDAVNVGPGDPVHAHTRDEQVAVEALVRSYETLERFACA